MKYLAVILKAFNILNGVWTRVKGPILGLLLLLSVCPLLSNNSETISLGIEAILQKQQRVSQFLFVLPCVT